MTRAQRARLIRRRIITGAVALFVAAWLVIAITLISGDDPALSRKRATASVVTTATAATTTTTIPTSTPTSAASSASGASSVSTHQS